MANISNMVRTFTGDDEYKVRQFIAEFESAIKALGCGPRYTDVCATKALGGTVKLCVTANGATQWNEIRNVLRENFTEILTDAEVYKGLQKRKKCDTESFHQYVLKMQEIAMMSGNLCVQDI